MDQWGTYLVLLEVLHPPSLQYPYLLFLHAVLWVLQRVTHFSHMTVTKFSLSLDATLMGL